MGLLEKKIESKHSVGKTIAKLRSEKGWTQVELAAKLGITDKAISKWESEAGMPDISQLPVLAEIFDTTIDYLLAGKQLESNIVYTSKIEDCAKKDSCELYEELKKENKLFVKDDNGKTLWQYIQTYSAYKVLERMLNENSAVSVFGIGYACLSEEKTIIFLLHAAKSNTLDKVIRDLKLSSIEDIDFSSHRYSQDYSTKNLFDTYLKIIEIILFNENGDQKLKERILCLEKDKTRSLKLKATIGWIYAYPWILDIAYNKNQNLFYNLLPLIEKNNLNGIKAYEEEEKKYHLNSSYNPSSYQRILKREHQFIYILKETILKAIENKDVELAEKLSNINKFIKHRATSAFTLTEQEIKVAKLNANTGLTKKEKDIQIVLDNGVIIIDELLKIGDNRFKIQMLKKYPISAAEEYIELWQTKNYTGILKFLMDKYPKNADAKYELNEIIKIENNKEYNNPLVYQENRVSLNQILDECLKKTNSNYIFKPKKYIDWHNIDKIKELLEMVKKDLISRFDLSEKYYVQTKNLDKKYFEKLYQEEDFEKLTIKLCIRLEAFLKMTYGEEVEDLQKLINMFNLDEETLALLHKLRLQRNSIVHPKDNSEDLTKDELDKCINIISELKI